MQSFLRVVAALALGITGVVVSTGSAAASCPPLSPPSSGAIANAGVAFVGTVAFTTNRDRTAYFAVDEIWQGPDLAWLTIVHGGPVDDPNSITSVDRTWRLGTRYLVFIGKGNKGELRDSACSFTTPYQSSFDALRPADARFRYGTLLGLAVVVLVAGGVAFIGWRVRRRRADRSRPVSGAP